MVWSIRTRGVFVSVLLAGCVLSGAIARADETPEPTAAPSASPSPTAAPTETPAPSATPSPAELKAEDYRRRLAGDIEHIVGVDLASKVKTGEKLTPAERALVDKATALVRGPADTTYTGYTVTKVPTGGTSFSPVDSSLKPTGKVITIPDKVTVDAKEPLVKTPVKEGTEKIPSGDEGLGTVKKPQPKPLGVDDGSTSNLALKEKIAAQAQAQAQGQGDSSPKVPKELAADPAPGGHNRGTADVARTGVDTPDLGVRGGMRGSDYVAAPPLPAQVQPAGPANRGLVAQRDEAPRPDVTRQVNTALVAEGQRQGLTPGQIERAAQDLRVQATNAVLTGATETLAAAPTPVRAAAPPVPRNDSTAVAVSTTAPLPGGNTNTATTTTAVTAVDQVARVGRGAADDGPRRTTPGSAAIDATPARTEPAPVAATNPAAGTNGPALPFAARLLAPAARPNDDVALVRTTLSDFTVAKVAPTLAVGSTALPSVLADGPAARAAGPGGPGRTVASHFGAPGAGGFVPDMNPGALAGGAPGGSQSAGAGRFFTMHGESNAGGARGARGMVERGSRALWRMVTGRGKIPAGAAQGSGWAFGALLLAMFARRKKLLPKKFQLTIRRPRFPMGNFALAGMGAAALLSALLVGGRRGPVGSKLIVLVKEVPKYIFLGSPGDAPATSATANVTENATAAAHPIYASRESDAPAPLVAAAGEIAGIADAAAPRVENTGTKKITARVSAYLERLVSAWKSRNVDAPSRAPAVLPDTGGRMLVGAKVGAPSAPVAVATSERPSADYEAAAFLPDDVVGGMGWAVAGLLVVFFFRRRRKMA